MRLGHDQQDTEGFQLEALFDFDLTNHLSSIFSVRDSYIVLVLLKSFPYRPWDWHFYLHLVDCYRKCR